MHPIERVKVSIVNKVYIPKSARDKVEITVKNNKLTLIKKQ